MVLFLTWQFCHSNLAWNQVSQPGVKHTSLSGHSESVSQLHTQCVTVYKTFYPLLDSNFGIKYFTTVKISELLKWKCLLKNLRTDLLSCPGNRLTGSASQPGDRWPARSPAAPVPWSPVPTAAPGLHRTWVRRYTKGEKIREVQGYSTRKKQLNKRRKQNSESCESET